MEGSSCVNLGRPLGATGVRPFVGSDSSNHDATAFTLRERGVHFESTESHPAPDLKTCRAAFWAALPEGDRYSEGDYNDLVTAVATQYQSGPDPNQGAETAFDIRLFEALKSYLGDMVADTETNKVSGKDQLSIIVLKGHWKVDGETYALGFSRQVTSAALGIPKNFGFSRMPRHDHSCVLLRKQGNEGKYRVMDTSATVELKTSKNTCHLRNVNVRYSKPNRVFVRNPMMSGRGGALSPVIAHTISDVWTCLARQGMKIGGQTPNRVRFGLLACKLLEATGEEKSQEQTEANVGEPLQKKQKPTSDPTWWALGDVIIPKVCGGSFGYEVNSFGSFTQSKKEEAAAAYLSVMTQGLQLLTSLKTNTTRPEPYPLSGKDLMFGTANVETKMLTYASPFSMTKEVGYLISQGEFWRGTIPTKDLKEMCQQPKKYNFRVVDKDLKQDEPLLIKVSCKPVFNSFVDPGRSFWAIKTLEDEEQLSALKGVLIAAWEAPKGLVTIMRDLQPLGYADLRPERTKASISYLWENFMELVRNQLLPLARAGVIHPDIRVGYNYTANIMAKSDGSDMVLVDLESLVELHSYEAPDDDKYGRYLPETKNAFAFVCLQCFVVATFWSERRNQLVEDKAMQARKVAVVLLFALYGKDVVEEDVEKLLRKIALQLENSGRLDTTALEGLFL